jgi:proline iminopeptidase
MTVKTDNNELPPIEDEHIIRSGRLKVGDGHELYWVDWGNPKIKEPIFYLHGGPGSGFDEKDFAKFEPARQRVVFHDQRGSGRSTPFAGTKHNTSHELVADVNRLRMELGFDKISLYGFSWGSTLALLYAIANPAVVSKMLIGGIYLARQTDNDFYLRGRIATHFPEVWERFRKQVPAGQQTDVAAYYRQLMTDPDEAVRKQAAKEWMVYEASILRLDYVPGAAERNLKDFAAESLAYLEAHYILNDCFIAENYILEQAATLKDIPVVIVHGRYDFICMPAAAYELQQAIGDRVRLHFVMSGHSTNDTVQREVIRAYTSMLW